MSTRRRSHGRKASPRRNTGSSSIRYVSSKARDVFDAAAVESMRKMCRAMETATEPLDGERLASQLHGRMWQLRRQATTKRQADWSFGLGAPFARQIARIGGPGAKGLLLTFGYQAPARLADLCAALALELDVPTPSWAEQVPLAQITRAAATERQDDVRMIALEFRRCPHQSFTLAVMVRERDAGIAAHYALLRPVEAMADGDHSGRFTSSGIAFSPIGISDACRQVENAIERADAAEPSQVDIASTKELRALTLGRTRGCSAHDLRWPGVSG